MSINFETFIKLTHFSATYAARKILYYPLSRPAQIAKAMGLAVPEDERTLMVKLCANKITLDDYRTAVSLSAKQRNTSGQAA